MARAKNIGELFIFPVPPSLALALALLPSKKISTANNPIVAKIVIVMLITIHILHFERFFYK